MTGLVLLQVVAVVVVAVVVDNLEAVLKYQVKERNTAWPLFKIVSN